MPLPILEPEAFEVFPLANEASSERERVQARVAAGERDANALTNVVFFARHPELPQRPLARGQETLMAEWRAILRDVVQPVLRTPAPTSGAAGAALALGPGVKVLLVGDSHTDGPFGQELERLMKASGARVVRAAKIGSAVTYWMPRFPALLRANSPDIVIVALGANMRTYPSASGTSAQIRQIVALVRRERSSAQILWVGPPRERADTDQRLGQFNSIIRNGLDVAVRFVDSAPYTPVYEGRDGVHYATQPANRWAAGVFAELVGHPSTAPVRPPPAQPVSAPAPVVVGGPTRDPVPAGAGDVSLGTLRHTAGNGTTFSYTFTPDDLEWTARYLMGEAGSDIERSSVLWAMLNRFVLYRRWKTFTTLLRAYSTPLQYPLNSVQAAYRHWKNCPGTKCQYVDLSSEFGFYTDFQGHRIPRGQLRPFIALQRTGWSQLDPAARRVAARVLSGNTPNIAGLVTEFDDTAVYWRDQHATSKGPTRQEWLDFTRQFATKKNVHLAVGHRALRSVPSQRAVRRVEVQSGDASLDRARRAQAGRSCRIPTGVGDGDARRSGSCTRRPRGR